VSLQVLTQEGSEEEVELSQQGVTINFSFGIFDILLRLRNVGLLK
jgi:hypothetical protein